MIKNYRNGIKKSCSQSLKARAEYFQKVYSNFKLPEQEDKEKYLDVGCGEGYNTLKFGEKFRQIYALEPNKKDLEKSKDHIQDKRVVFIAGDAQNLNFKNNLFDLITIFSVIEHIPDTDRVIKELKRVLKNEGRLLIQLPNRYFFVELHTYLPFLYLLPEKIRNALIKKLGYSEDALLACKLSKNRLIKIIKKNNLEFRIKKMTYPASLLPKRFVWIYNILKRWRIFDLVPFGYFIVCTKREGKQIK